jgi:hypothetical protein
MIVAVLNKEKLYQEYCINGLTDKAIGLKYGCDKTNIQKLRKKYNIDTIVYAERRRKISKEKLIQEYIVNKKSMPQIAIEYNTCVEVLFKYKKEFDIKTIDKIDRIKHIYPNNDNNYIGLQILYGTLLGDGYLNNSNKNVRLQLKHCKFQLEWLKFKKEQLSSFLNMNDIKTLTPKGNYKNVQDSCYCNSYKHPWLTKFYSQIYDENGVKYISRSYLDMLDEIGIATWFIDDGSYNQNAYLLCTECFNYGEQLIIQQYFKEKWNCECHILKKHKNKNQYYLYFYVKSSNIIRTMIENLAKNINGLEYKYTNIRLCDYKKVVNING